MSGTTHRLKPLELRKQLLLTESELNRVRFVQEWEGVAEGIHAVANRAKSLGLLASSAAGLVSVVAAFKRGRTAEPGVKPSRFGKILRGAGLLANLWLAFQSRRRGPGNS